MMRDSGNLGPQLYHLSELNFEFPIVLVLEMRREIVIQFHFDQSDIFLIGWWKSIDDIWWKFSKGKNRNER